MILREFLTTRYALFTPKNKGFTNPLYNKKFKVIHDQDAALNYVSNSKFVIVNSTTTAITHAVSKL